MNFILNEGGLAGKTIRSVDRIGFGNERLLLRFDGDEAAIVDVELDVDDCWRLHLITDRRFSPAEKHHAGLISNAEREQAREEERLKTEAKERAELERLQRKYA